MRQNFLPTTRVHGDTNEQENEIKMVLSSRSSNGDEINRKTSLTRLNMLNIQNQYQYQETTRSLSPIPNANEYDNQPATNQSVLIAPEMYGKPIVSPRPYGMESVPSFPPPPPSLLNSTLDTSALSLDRKHLVPNKTEVSKTMRMKTNENNDSRNAYATQPEIQIFGAERLKKTKQGSVLLGRSEGHNTEKENFDEEIPDYRASELLGRMSLSIERLNSPDREEAPDEKQPKFNQSHIPRAKLYDTPFNKLKTSTEELEISPREFKTSPREFTISPSCLLYTSPSPRDS